MNLARALPLAVVLAAGTAAAQEAPAGMSLDWPDHASWRTLDQWELRVAPQGGDEVVRSGVLRARWDVRAEGDGRTLAQEAPITVRASPRGDAEAAAIGAALAQPWRVRVPPAPAPAAPVAALEAPPEGAPDEGTPADGAPADGAPTEAAPTEAPAPEPVAAAVPPPSAPDRVALVEARLPERLARLLAVLDGVALTPEGLAGVALAPGEVIEVGEVAPCPATGPGTSCVPVTVSRAEGDPAAGSGHHEALTWLLEPATLVPHAATLAAEVAWTDAKGIPQRATVRRTLALLPAEAPALR